MLKGAPRAAVYSASQSAEWKRSTDPAEHRGILRRHLVAEDGVAEETRGAFGRASREGHGL